MLDNEKTILVFGATGQQGGAVAKALRADGWSVRAFVRNATSEKARVLAAAGMALAAGDLSDRSSVEAAMAGCYGVFSVQPSSGQGAAYGVSDEDEVLYGTMIADVAFAAGIDHLVYSSANAAGPTKTGMGHFDSKSEIEAHIREIGVRHTIVRPSAFMEMLMLPGMGLDRGEFRFFMRRDQPMQFIAVEDIGRIVAKIFADPARFGFQTLEIAGDNVTGAQLGEALTRAAGRPIAYGRFDDDLLARNAFLGKLAAMVDEGRLAGAADLVRLRQMVPGLLTFERWLEGAGKPLLQKAIASGEGEVALR